jgi:hypothetical protein
MNWLGSVSYETGLVVSITLTTNTPNQLTSGIFSETQGECDHASASEASETAVRAAPSVRVPDAEPLAV